jgi:hypothetical protein
MPAYDKKKIKGFLHAADNAATKAERGKAFEELACYLFGLVPRLSPLGEQGHLEILAKDLADGELLRG